ncbi:hypothetical protein NHX12_007533, partial [Muraenolepis orangiensis]
MAHEFHQLSFCGRILSLQCKRSPGTESSASQISLCSLHFDRESQSFAGAQDDVRVLPAVDVVTCACVYDAENRVTSPFALLQTGHKDKKGHYPYSLLAVEGGGGGSSVKRETRMTFRLPYRLGEMAHIVPGPVVWWTHGGQTLFCTSEPGSDVGVVRPMSAAPLSRPIVGVLPLIRGDVVFIIVGPTRERSEELGSFETEASGHVKSPTDSRSHGYFLVSGVTFDPAVILPCVYTSIARCIKVLHAEKVGDVLKRSSVVAATSEKQLVYFEDGLPRDVCQLPFDDPRDIRVVDTGRHGRLIVVGFDRGHVCAIWKETFKVAARWSGVRSAHVDDFLGCGTEQLLLVFEEEEPTGRPLDPFLLTDLCGGTFSSREKSGGMDAASPPAVDNYLLTFQALESRLQIGLTVVQELQRDVALKQRVLVQSIQALTDIVSGRDPVLTHHQQEGLFSLWDEDEEAEVCDVVVSDDEMQVVTPESPAGPRVEALWHHFAEDSLVAGATLTVDSSVPADCVTLSILTDASPGSAPATAAAGPRIRLAVTAVTRLTSLLSWGRVDCPVVLRYVRRERSPADKPTPVAFQCGRVSLDVRADFHGRLLTDPELTTEEELLSALSVLDRWVFRVDSPHRRLGDLDRWLQRAARGQRLKVDPRYLLANPQGPSAAMLLRWQPSSPFGGELSVHSSRLQMLQFLEAWSHFLPPSCTVRPLNGTAGDPREASRVLALALEREAIALKRGLSSLLLHGGEERRGEGSRRPDDSPEARGSADGRRVSGREREKDLGRSPPVDVERYRALTRSLCEVQLEADVTALLQTKSSSYDDLLKRPPEHP